MAIAAASSVVVAPRWNSTVASVNGITISATAEGMVNASDTFGSAADLRVRSLFVPRLEPARQVGQQYHANRNPQPRPKGSW